MLADVERDVIIAMRRQGVSYTGIAEQLALSPNTVKSICRRNGATALQIAEHPANVCKNCGKPLQQTPGGRDKIFCGDKCRYQWWNRKRSRHPYRLICSYCGKQFISYGNKSRKFCGRDCYTLSRYGEGLP